MRMETISVVEFFAGTNKVGEATDAPFGFMWSNVLAGDYALTASRDGSTTARRRFLRVTIISVTTNIPPVVAIMSPRLALDSQRPRTSLFPPMHPDADGRCNWCNFYEGTNKLGEVTTPPYSLVWSNVPRGEFC
jgi:hypothetical protein